MLILMRRKDESIHIGDDVEIVVTKIQGGQVHLGIKAPRDVDIRRAELDNVDEVKSKKNA